MQKKIFVKSYDSLLEEYLNNVKTGRVHSVFKSAINIELCDGSAELRVRPAEAPPTPRPSWKVSTPCLSGEVSAPRPSCMISIINSKYNQPGAVLVDISSTNGFPEFGITSGETVKINFPEISTGDVRFVAGGYAWREKFKREKVTRPVKQLFSSRSCWSTDDTWGIMSKAKARGLNDLYTLAEEIIGLGDGLTPAGDDFLVGLLNSIYYRYKIRGMKKLKPAWDKLSNAVRQVKHRTNAISESFIDYSLAGRFSERAVNLLNFPAAELAEGNFSLLGLHSDGLQDTGSSIFEQFRGWGHNSGFYVLSGLISGLILP